MILEKFATFTIFSKQTQKVHNFILIEHKLTKGLFYFFQGRFNTLTKVTRWLFNNCSVTKLLMTDQMLTLFVPTFCRAV